MSDEISGEVQGRAGGVARAEKLTAAERREIAKRAAATRWGSAQGLPRATHAGSLNMGDDISIPCAVLEDGRRVLWQQGFLRALGRTGRARTSAVPLDPTASSFELPLFLSADNLKPFITEDLIAAAKPVVFRPLQGGPMSVGYLAELLPRACGAIMEAGDRAPLRANQQHIYERAKILVRGLAIVGITALVDEATGYQEVRPKDALQLYLEKIIRKELAAWIKTFPDEFYENIYKLKGWDWPGMSKNRYSVVAHYTNDLVYERLGPGVRDELQRKNPKNEKGRRPAKNTQWFTAEIGHPMLSQHLYSLVMFQRLALAQSYGWNRFVKMVDKVHPKKGTTLELPFGDSNEFEVLGA